MKTIEQLMDRAEALNMISDGIKIEVTVLDFEDMDNAKKLCKQQSGYIFEKSIILETEWCSFMLGDVEFIVSGKSKN